MATLVTFGETMLRLSPEHSERIETATELEFRCAGAESNVAIAASNLGIDATWMSKLPVSPLGRRVTREVRSHGVETEVNWSEKGRQGIYYLEDGGKPRGTNVIYDRKHAAIRTLSSDELMDMVELDEINACYVSGITPALSGTLQTATKELFRRCQASGVTTIFDLNYRSKLWSPDAAREACEPIVDYVDVFICANRDARTVLEKEGEDETILENLTSNYDPDVVVLTQGEDGAIAHDSDDGMYDQPAFPTEMTCPIGTGDAFVGGFIADYLETDKVESALEYGAATAALKRTIKGDVAVITPDEVDQVIAETGTKIAR